MTETTRLLRDLVALPSVNPMGRDLQGDTLYEHRVTAYLEEFFRGLGVPVERQLVAPGRENIIGRWDRPGARRTLLCEAHQDTQPAENMTIEPFAARIDAGRLYGRGACDIKGGMAAMLAAFARLVRERPASGPNVWMACTVDEEHTFLGVRRLAQDLRANLAVVAEPTRLAIVHAHKGVVRWHLETTGRACHSSSPEQGVNAIHRMARLVEVIDQYAGDLRHGRVDPVLGPATLNVGRIEGGSSVNTVPDRCRIEVDRRLVADESPRQAIEELTGFLRGRVDFPFECNEVGLSAPALSPRGSEELTARLGECIDAVVGRHQVMAVPYCTNAAVIAAAGVPAVVFGPGDIAQAHTADEWVSLDEVEQASEVLYRLMTLPE